MIRYASGDIFDEPAEVRINTVNCVGVMGAGVALAFKTRYPDMFRDYQKACKKGEVNPGSLHTWKTVLGEWIVNFPTKRHWREPSRYEDIETGLIALKNFLVKLGNIRVMLPALGCGHGGLDWSRVSTIIEKHLGDLDSEIIVFSPQSSRDAGEKVKHSEENIDELKAEGIAIIGPGDDSYPAVLKGKSASVLYLKGDAGIFGEPILSVVLSDKPQDRELKAVSECIDIVVKSDITIMFSYGVSERILIRKALENRGKVILCLAEGIMNFTVRKDLKDVWDDNRVTVISTSKPCDRWSPIAAFKVKYLELTFSHATLISDPEPQWLAKFAQASELRQMPQIFYLRYSPENENTREIFHKLHAQSIGRSPLTGNPNMHPVLLNFRDVPLSVHSQTVAESEITFENSAEDPIPLHNSDKGLTTKENIKTYEIFIKYFDDITSQKAMTENELSDCLNTSKSQLKKWLKQGVFEKRIEKLSRPVRYKLVTRNQLELNI